MFKSSIRKKSDDELMHMISEGNAQAVTEIYQRYSNRLVRYFFRMLWRDEVKAQDFVHDLFLKIISNPRHYSSRERFSTWLFSVAHNMCKNEYRREAFRKTVHSDDIRLSIVDDGPYQELEWKEAIEKALAMIDEDERHLFVLRYEVELPLEEIAEMLGCPVGTVKSRVFNLKKKLAKCLKHDYPEKVKYGI